MYEYSRMVIQWLYTQQTNKNNIAPLSIIVYYKAIMNMNINQYIDSYKLKMLHTCIWVHSKADPLVD